MTKFTPFEYICIAIANHYGMDKELWQTRIDWTMNHLREGTLTKQLDDADEPLLMAKAMYALEDAMQGNPTGYIMNLDATASGYQIMGALVGCRTTCLNTNALDAGHRADIYTKVADTMNRLGANVTRSIVKKPIMTVGYGSEKQPESIFGEATPELKAFYDTLARELPGGMEVMADIKSCWQGDELAHTWTLPDGHTAHVRVGDTIDKDLELDELGVRMKYRAWVNMKQETGRSLMANVIHS